MTAASATRPTTHTISLLVANKPGVLVRIALVFARRGYNIDSLVVSPAHDPRFSRMTITAQGDPETLEQIIKQADKLIDVIHAGEHNEADAVHTELALIKVRFTPTTKPILMKLARRFHAHLLDETGPALIFSVAGPSHQLDEFEKLLKKYGVIEMVRTGKVVMAKGGAET